MADHQLFPPQTVGFSDFSQTVLSVVSLAYRANCRAAHELAANFTSLGEDLINLGIGLVRGGYNFAAHFTQATTNLIRHPIATTTQLGRVTKRAAIHLLKIFKSLNGLDQDPDSFQPYAIAIHDYVVAARDRFHAYRQAPRAEQITKLGEVVGEQLLAFGVGWLTGQAVSVVCNATALAELSEVAQRVKKPRSKVKKLRLQDFGSAGHDAAQVLGLAVAEEIELATLDGVIVKLRKTPDIPGQTLFHQAEDYFKQNPGVKKAKGGALEKSGSGTATNTVSSAEQKLTQLPEVNQSPVAIFKDGYYEVNGFKFTEYYYNRLWNNGRSAPSLIAKEILESNPTITPDHRTGFLMYKLDDWEMVYNPTTKEIHHLRQRHPRDKK